MTLLPGRGCSRYVVTGELEQARVADERAVRFEQLAHHLAAIGQGQPAAERAGQHEGPQLVERTGQCDVEDRLLPVNVRQYHRLEHVRHRRAEWVTAGAVEEDARL